MKSKSLHFDLVAQPRFSPKDLSTFGLGDAASDEEEHGDKAEDPMFDHDSPTFQDIADEIGYAGRPGAKYAVVAALDRAQRWAAVLEARPELLDDMVHRYTHKLVDSGALDRNEADLLWQNPGLVAELDGFRDFMAKKLARLEASGGRL